MYLADDVLTLGGLRVGRCGGGVLSFPQEARGMRRSAARASARVRKITFFMLVIIVRECDEVSSTRDGRPLVESVLYGEGLLSLPLSLNACDGEA